MFSSIATVSVSGTLEGKLRAIAKAGFEGVEIFENDLLTSNCSARDVANLLHDLGLSCTLFQPFRDFEGMPDALRPRIFERLERKFELMQAMGAPLLLVCSNVSPASLPDRGRIVRDLRELGEHAESRGLRVGYEALAWGRHVNDHREAWSIVREVNHPAVGLILDSFHSLARGIPNASLRDIDPTRVFIVQLADAPMVQMDYLSWSRHLRNLPGQGDFPLTEYASTLIECGYTGIFSLEIFNDRFRSSSASSVALDAHRSLTFLADQVHRRVALPDRPHLPPRTRTHGVAFIEFAANEAEVDLLGRLFTSLGFQPAGRHKHKDVIRWRQNGINFVLNAEPGSFAREYDAIHGASICAIGVSTENVPAALRRADALQISRFSQASPPDGFELPAVLGIGGSLIYFMEAGSEDEVWNAEFLGESLPGAMHGAGLMRVDHIAQTMQYDETLSWLLYYHSLFDVSKQPIAQVADPLGLVQTQAIESPDGGFRVTLNASASLQTLSGRFVQGYHGAGVQHIALASPDIFASARKLRELGLEVLPIPQNYYEDLAARFGLDHATLEALESFNILYDRDSDGEYLHLVSRAFSKRFFFEIVERRGYRGYGGANAAVRLAAQSRYRDDLEQ